jgi:hypothetical protein
MGMAPADVLRELASLARRLGVAVRFEALEAHAKGGLCKLRGEPIVVVDCAAPVLDQIGVLSEALRAFDLEALYVPPFLRAHLEGRNAAPRTRSHPPLRKARAAKARGGRR